MTTATGQGSVSEKHKKIVHTDTASRCRFATRSAAEQSYATATTAMKHVAIAERLDGMTAD
jgi:hypothetical protein